jgi:hypothetical protein
MSGRCAALFVFVCAMSCTKANPDASCTNGTCTDPDFPYCDFDGAIGGSSGECIAVTCAPGDIAECSGSDALTCNATGNGYALDSCALGCTNTGSAHCAYLQPTYLPNVCDTPESGSGIVFSGSGSFDPNLDANCTGGIVPQVGAAEVCVVRGRTIDVPDDATVTVVGTAGGGRAIALVADYDLRVEGFIDVGAHTGINGPGGGTFTSGRLPYIQSGLLFGGGGAGGAGSGGDGGEHATPNDNGGVVGGAEDGGAPTPNPISSTVLVGGAATPDPGSDTDLEGLTITSIGGGGGAIELVSCHGAVDITGIVNAGGGGGGFGIDPLVPVSGFGGGAGGNIVVEGVAVTVTGSLFANGGGGGGGACLMDGVRTSGTSGSDGSLSDTVPAAGGSGCGPGGAGGVAGIDASPGSFSNGDGSGIYAPGGGGGSVGFLQTYTPNGVAPTITPSHVSPAFQPNGTVQTR